MHSDLSAITLPRSGSSLSRLGKRLALGSASETDINEYDEFIIWAQFVAELLEDELRGIDWPSILHRAVQPRVTSRAKSKDTLVQKLQMRPGLQLPRIRDIIGARIVANVTLSEQDRMVSHLYEHFDCTEPSQIIDRRQVPSAGYRAVHLEVKINNVYMEIQVRTAWQDEWAEMFEGMADTWGREIRYVPALINDTALVEGGTGTRQAVVDIARNLSVNIIAAAERVEDKLAQSSQRLIAASEGLQALRKRLDKISDVPDGTFVTEVRDEYGRRQKEYEAGLAQASELRVEFEAAKVQLREIIRIMHKTYTLTLQDEAGGAL